MMFKSGHAKFAYWLVIATLAAGCGEKRKDEPTSEEARVNGPMFSLVDFVPNTTSNLVAMSDETAILYMSSIARNACLSDSCGAEETLGGLSAQSYGVQASTNEAPTRCADPVQDDVLYVPEENRLILRMVRNCTQPDPTGPFRHITERHYQIVECPNTNLETYARYSSLQLRQVGSGLCNADYGFKELVQIELNSKTTLPSGEVRTETESLALMTSTGELCELTVDKETFEIRRPDCGRYYRSHQSVEIDSERKEQVSHLINWTMQDAIGYLDEPFYSRGAIRATINQWSGEVTFVEGNTAPTWYLESSGGAFSGVVGE